jgi:molecular chaperone DnaK
LKKAVETDNLDEIKAATEKLTEIVQQLSVKLYEQAAQEAGANGAAEGNAAGGPGKDNVVDADYEVIDEDKK